MSDCPGEFCRDAGLSKRHLLNVAARGFDGGRRRSQRLSSTSDDSVEVRTGQMVSMRDYKSRGCGFDPQSGLQIFCGTPPLGLL